MNKTLQESLEFMLLNQIGCDVAFVVGDQQEPIHAHKVVLASRSPVFFSLFERVMEENNLNQEQMPGRVNSVASLKNIDQNKQPLSESRTSNKSTSISVGKGDGWVNMSDSSTFKKQQFTESLVGTPKQPKQPLANPEPEVKPKKIYTIADADLKTFKIFLRYVIYHT